jgi:hypothetical protein
LPIGRCSWSRFTAATQFGRRSACFRHNERASLRLSAINSPTTAFLTGVMRSASIDAKGRREGMGHDPRSRSAPCVGRPSTSCGLGWIEVLLLRLIEKLEQSMPFTIEYLWRGHQSPVERVTSFANHVAAAERSARRGMARVRITQPDTPPDGYRILDNDGTVLVIRSITL